MTSCNCRFVITFLPESASFNFTAAVSVPSDFGTQKINSVTVSIFFGMSLVPFYSIIDFFFNAIDLFENGSFIL